MSRIFDRHRIDLAKFHFGKDGGYTLREFKKIMKIEMDEHPERYIIKSGEKEESPETKIAKIKRDLDKARKTAEKEGPLFLEMSKSRSAEIQTLRDKLDSHVPQLKKLMA